MKHSLAIPASLLLAVGAAAQTTSIVPSSAASTSPASWNSTIFWGTTSTTLQNESRTQVLYDAADVSNSGVIQSIEFRRPANLGNQNIVASFNLKIDLSMSPVNYLAAVGTYASNHGPTKITVFNGPVNLPANSSGAWPRPWEAPIPFTAPFPFIAASTASLCAEFETTGNTTTQIWYLEGATANTGAGTFTSNLTNTACQHSGNVANNAISYRTPTVGQVWGPVTWQNLPENNPSWNANACLLGTQGVGGLFGGLPLPIPLTTLGLTPSNPACQLANDILITLPLTYNTNATVNRGTLVLPAINVPNDPTIAGLQLFTQPLALDVNPATQVPGLWTGWSGRWNIGDGVRRGLPLTTISNNGNNTAVSGTVATYTGPTLKLNF